MSTKFSQFPYGYNPRTSDILVGLRAGGNEQFTLTGINDPNGNPILLWSPGNLTIQGPGSLGLPVDTTAQLPAGYAGALAYSSTLDAPVYWSVTLASWQQVGTGGVIDVINGTANQINAVTVGATTTLSLPTTLILPGSMNVGNLLLNGSTLSSTNTNGNINLTPNGTGKNVLANAQVTNLTASTAVVTDASNDLASSLTTAIEIGYVHGVTSSIQAQINAITAGTVTSVVGTANEITANTVSGVVTLSLPTNLIAPGTFTVGNLLMSGNTLSSTNINGNINLTPEGSGINVLANAQVSNIATQHAVATDGSSNLVASSTTATELGYVHGVTSSIQAQINAITSGTVLSVSGTANQITATTVSGNVTLSLPSAVTFPGTVTLNANPTLALQAATKQYVDSISAGLSFTAPAYVVVTTNLNATYNNGTAGVGATLTNAGAQAAFVGDGVTVPINSAVLVAGQTASADNGIYILTTVGSGASNWVLTRATYYNNTSEIKPGTFTLITNGATLANTAWIQTATVTTIGTDPITFVEFNPASNAVVSVTATSPLASSGGTTPNISIASNIPLNLGGTNASLTASAGGLVYSTGSAMAILGGTGTANQIPLSGSASAPAWSTATYLNTMTLNGIMYASSANVMGQISVVDSAVLITSAAGVPSLAALTDGQLIIGSSTGAPIAATLTAGTGIGIVNGHNTITISASTSTATTFDGDSGSATPSSNTITFTGGTTGLTFTGASATMTLGGVAALANGGTNHALTASNGGLVYSDASKLDILAGTATANQIPLSGASAAPSWSTATYLSTLVANELVYASSTNTMAQLATANNSILATNGSGVPAFTTTMPTAVQLSVSNYNNGTGASTSTYLRGDGTWAATSGAGVLVPLATLTASNSASLAFTNLFSSSYYQYLFLFNQLLPATNNVILYTQLGTGAGPTYITTGYNWNLNSFVAGSFNSGNAVTSDTQGLVSNQSGTYGINSTDGNLSGSMIISGPKGGSQAANATVMTSHKSAGGTPYGSINTGNWSQAAATFTAIKFYPSSGNITSGTIDVYAYLAA